MQLGDLGGGVQYVIQNGGGARIVPASGQAVYADQGQGLGAKVVLQQGANGRAQPVLISQIHVQSMPGVQPLTNGQIKPQSVHSVQSVRHVPTFVQSQQPGQQIMLNDLSSGVGPRLVIQQGVPAQRGGQVVNLQGRTLLPNGASVMLQANGNTLQPTHQTTIPATYVMQQASGNMGMAQQQGLMQQATTVLTTRPVNPQLSQRIRIPKLGTVTTYNPATGGVHLSPTGAAGVGGPTISVVQANGIQRIIPTGTQLVQQPNGTLVATSMPQQQQASMRVQQPQQVQFQVQTQQGGQVAQQQLLAAQGGRLPIGQGQGQRVAMVNSGGGTVPQQVISVAGMQPTNSPQPDQNSLLTRLLQVQANRDTVVKVSANQPLQLQGGKRMTPQAAQQLQLQPAASNPQQALLQALKSGQHAPGGQQPIPGHILHQLQAQGLLKQQQQQEGSQQQQSMLGALKVDGGMDTRFSFQQGQPLQRQVQLFQSGVQSQQDGYQHESAPPLQYTRMVPAGAMLAHSEQQELQQSDGQRLIKTLSDPLQMGSTNCISTSMAMSSIGHQQQQGGLLMQSSSNSSSMSGPLPTADKLLFNLQQQQQQQGGLMMQMGLAAFNGQVSQPLHGNGIPSDGSSGSKAVAINSNAAGGAGLLGGGDESLLSAAGSKEDLAKILSSIGVELARHKISVESAVGAGWLGVLAPSDVSTLTEAYINEAQRICGQPGTGDDSSGGTASDAGKAQGAASSIDLGCSASNNGFQLGSLQLGPENAHLLDGLELDAEMYGGLLSADVAEQLLALQGDEFNASQLYRTCMGELNSVGVPGDPLDGSGEGGSNNGDAHSANDDFTNTSQREPSPSGSIGSGRSIGSASGRTSSIGSSRPEASVAAPAVKSSIQLNGRGLCGGAPATGNTELAARFANLDLGCGFF